MEHMHELKEKLCEELEEIGRKGELSAGDLETVHKLTDTIKNIYKIGMLEEDGYSHAGDWEAMGRYDDDMSYARRRRDSMGRYVRDERDGRDGRYSRDGSKQSMMRKLDEMMKNASTERERDALRRCMEQIEKA